MMRRACPMLLPCRWRSRGGAWTTARPPGPTTAHQGRPCVSWKYCRPVMTHALVKKASCLAAAMAARSPARTAWAMAASASSDPSGSGHQVDGSCCAANDASSPAACCAVLAGALRPKRLSQNDDKELRCRTALNDCCWWCWCWWNCSRSGSCRGWDDDGPSLVLEAPMQSASPIELPRCSSVDWVRSRDRAARRIVLLIARHPAGTSLRPCIAHTAGRHTHRGQAHTSSRSQRRQLSVSSLREGALPNDGLHQGDAHRGGRAPEPGAPQPLRRRSPGASEGRPDCLLIRP